MGSATARWCHDILLEFATLPPDQNAFRSFREGNKVFVIQKQRNGKGRFASMTVLGETKERGVVIIPEGRDAGGWRGFSQEINGALTPAVPAVPKVNHQREQPPPPAEYGAQRSSNSNGDLSSFKEVVILGNPIPKISHVNAGSPEESRNCSNSDNVEILLKVIMNCGPDNKWAVKWAGVLDNPSDPALSHNPVDSKVADIGPRELIKPNVEARPKLDFSCQAHFKREKSNHAHKPVTKPTNPKIAPKFIWRPRSGSSAKECRRTFWKYETQTTCRSIVRNRIRSIRFAALRFAVLRFRAGHRADLATSSHHRGVPRDRCGI
jgi:hypothetical protein